MLSWDAEKQHGDHMILILSLMSDFGSGLLDATNASKLLLDQLEERHLHDQSKNASKY